MRDRRGLHIIVLLLIVLLTFSNCSTITKQPEITSVKELAIVSVYVNNGIHNINQQQPRAGVNLDTLKMIVGGEEDIETNELLQLATSGLESFYKALNNLAQWKILEPKDVIHHNSYNIIADNKQYIIRYTSAAKMFIMPFNDAAETSNITYVNGKEIHEENRKKLAQLCKALDVDGVAIVEIDLAYETELLSGLQGTGLLSAVKAPAMPNVGVNVLIIDKDASIAAQGSGERIKGKSVPMLHKGRPVLEHAEGLVVKEYARIIKECAQALKEKIEKELSS